MKTFLNSHSVYKLIVIVFVVFTVVKIRSQLLTLKTYNAEISSLNEKIAMFEAQSNKNIENSSKSREDNEELARKNLKMYYPNETPYKGY